MHMSDLEDERTGDRAAVDERFERSREFGVGSPKDPESSAPLSSIGRCSVPRQGSIRSSLFSRCWSSSKLHLGRRKPEDGSCGWGVLILPVPARPVAEGYSVRAERPKLTGLGYTADLSSHPFVACPAHFRRPSWQSHAQQALARLQRSQMPSR